MLGTNWQRIAGALLACSMAVLLTFGLVSCGKKSMAVLSDDNHRPIADQLPTLRQPISRGAEISEVSPPGVIQELRQILEGNQPQVEIISPQPDEVLEDNTVLVKLKVEDLKLFKDTKLGLGPHLQVFVDNQPSQAVYDLTQSLALQDLTPGTHTLRVFATYPWDESFKNEGAYAQTTFHVFTKTQDSNPNQALSLLTYNRPQGNYGAEPIMLDFYLINAPLHLVAQERPDDDIVDWQIRCTINGVSFTLDRWQPIYLEGFKPGKNWVQLEFLDERGNLVQNVFNRPIRLITYEPGGKDTLSQLVRGELKAADAHRIVDPNYNAETLVPTPAPSPSSSLTPSPEPSPVSPSPSVGIPSTTPTPTPEPSTSVTPIPSPTPTVIETLPVEAPKDEQAIPKTAEPPAPNAAEPAGAKQSEKSTLRSFLDRFQRPSSSPSPSPSLPPTLPEVIVTPSPDGDVPRSPELAPPEILPLPSEQAVPSKQDVTMPTERLSPSPLGTATSAETPQGDQQPGSTQELQPSATHHEQPAAADPLSESDKADQS